MTTGTQGSARGSSILVVLAAASMIGGLHAVNFLLEATGTAPGASTAGRHVAGAPRARDAEPSSGPGQTREPLCSSEGVAISVAACGVSPPARRVPGGTAYQVTTVAGEALWVILPVARSGERRVVAVPHAPIGWLGKPGGSELQVTTAPPLDVVGRFCEAARACDPAVATRKTLPNGATLTRWRLRPPAANDEVVTLQMGIWVLAFREVVPTVTEFVSGLLGWRLEGGFLVLDSPDPTFPIYDDWAGVVISVAGDGAPYSVTVTPGCELSEKRPDIGRADAGVRLQLQRRGGVPGGEWCSARYWVEARNLEGPSLRQLYKDLKIVPVGP